jgi:hypothetical protein
MCPTRQNPADSPLDGLSCTEASVPIFVVLAICIEWSNIGYTANVRR